MKSIKIFPLLFAALSLLTFISSEAQVKITDGALLTMDPNSLLELESTNKGFLPPRVVINSLNSVSPLSGTVPAGMLVYSSGGTVTDGYYLWNGTKWKPFLTGTGGVNLVAKTANATLTKTETFVVASNDITLTLPVVTSADDGLSISINNVGTYIDLVIVVPAGSATIDGEDHTHLTRWVGFNFIAYNGNWVVANNINKSEDIFDVSETSSWRNVQEVVEYLTAHMFAPSIVRLDGDVFSLTSTQIINLPYAVTFEGLSFGVTTISAASGFTGGLFSCVTECYFKMIKFTSTFGATGGHDALRLSGPGKFYGVKNCNFSGFNKGISITSNCTVFLFENSYQNNISAGVEVAAGAASGATLSAHSEVFSVCGSGINLVSGINAILVIQNCHFFCGSGAQTGLNYVPASFTTTSSMTFTNNSWNYIGSFISGFDFTRADGRDANFYIENNAGLDDKNPHCKINVVNNALTTTCVTAGIWYKANWTNTSSITTKFLINNNRVTYQANNSRSIYVIVSGNVSVNVAGEVITIGIVKNGVTTTRYGETTLRTQAATQPFQYSTVILLSNVVKNDYFELFASAGNNGDILTFQDVNIFVDSK